MNWRNWVPFFNKTNLHRANGAQSGRRKKLRLEALEQRRLLSVSVEELNTLNALYSDLKLESFDEYNVLEIDADALTTESLQNAVQVAESTAQDDLIVIRTNDETCTIQFDETLRISLDSTVSGALSIVTLGDASLRVAGEMPTLVEIESGVVQFGGMTFVSTLDALQNADLAGGEGFSSTLVSVSETAEVAYDSTLFVVGADSLTRLSGTYYSVEFQVSGSTTQWAYIAGLTAADINTLETNFCGNTENGREFFTGDFIDAEKEWNNGADDDDDLMCWAASLSNLLWYTDWGNAALATDEDGNPLFQSEDDLFKYFCDSFSDAGGNAYYGFDWFVTRNYTASGSDYEEKGWSQIKDGKGGNGGFYEGDYTQEDMEDMIASIPANTAGIEGCTATTGIEYLTEFLRAGCGIGLGIGYYSSETPTELTGGHAITVWGYVYDTQYDVSETSHYVGLFITDSDDTQGDDAAGSLNNLYYNPMAYDTTREEWYFTNYLSYRYYLYEITIIAPYTSQVSISTDSASASLSASTIHAGDSLSLSDVSISVGELEQSHVFTVSVYASLDDAISADSDILLGTTTVESLSKSTQKTLNFTDLDTAQLTPNANYYIGWSIDSILDTDLTDNVAVLSETLSVVPLAIDGISLSSETVEYDGTAHLPTVVGAQEGDQIRYSLDGNSYDTASALNITDVGTYTVWVAVSRDGYQDWKGSATVTVSPKTLTVAVSATDKIYDGTTSATGSATLEGVVDGDSVTLSGGTWAFSDENAGTHSVTYSDYALSGDDAGNYALSETSATTSTTITQATLNVTINATDKIYDGTTSATGSATLEGVVDGDSVMLSGGKWAFNSENAGTQSVTYSGYALIGDDAGNYALSATSATTSATITPAQLDAPKISAVGTSISSITLNITAVENAFSYHVIVSRDAEGTQIEQDKYLDATESIVFSGLTEATEYFITVTAVGSENYANSAKTQTSARTWTRQFNLEIQNAGAMATDCVMSGETLAVSGIEITNTGRDLSREYDVLFYAVPVQKTETDAVLLATVSRTGIESGAIDALPEQILNLSTLASGQYTLYWTASAYGTETDATDNTAQLSSTLNILTDATFQITDATKTLKNPTSDTENQTEITEWSAFKLNVNPEWKSEPELGAESETSLIRIAYDSRLFTLVEDETQTAPDVEATILEYSNNSETGMREVLISVTRTLKNNAEEVLPILSGTQETPAPVQLSFVPVAKNTLTAGTSAKDWLFCNGNAQSISVASFPYDLNEDGSVTILDLVEFARHFNEKATDSEMSNACDFNRDGAVTILDLVEFARKFNMKADDK